LLVLKLAGVNVAIVIQVGRDIQGKAVKANPSFNCNSEGCNFTVFNPDTTVLRLPPSAEVKVGPLRSKLFRRGQNVARTSTSTQGDYRLVLYQEQSIGDALPLAELDQFPLQVEYLEVFGMTEINQPSGIIYHWSFVLRHKAQG
jgi:hypothetical protein